MKENYTIHIPSEFFKEDYSPMNDPIYKASGILRAFNDVDELDGRDGVSLSDIIRCLHNPGVVPSEETDKVIVKDIVVSGHDIEFSLEGPSITVEVDKLLANELGLDFFVSREPVQGNGTGPASRYYVMADIDRVSKNTMMRIFSSMDASSLAELLGIFPRSSYDSRLNCYSKITINIEALLLEVGKYSSNEWPAFYSKPGFYFKEMAPGELLKPLMLEFLKHQETDYLHKLYSTYRFHNGPVMDMTVLASRNEFFYRDFNFCYVCGNTWPRMSFRHFDDGGNQVEADKESRVLLDLVLPLWDTKPETFWDSMKDRPVGHSGDIFVHVRENGSVSIHDRYFHRDLSFNGGVEGLFDFAKGGLSVGPLYFEDVSGRELNYGGVPTFLVKPLYDFLLIREGKRLVDVGIERNYGSFNKSLNKMEPVLKFLSDCQVNVPENFEQAARKEMKRSNATKKYKSFVSASGKSVKEGVGQKKNS